MKWKQRAVGALFWKSWNNDAHMLMSNSCFLGQLGSICSSTFHLFSASFSLVLHPSLSISPLAPPSHLYQWNYCQGTVIIEFPDSRTLAPPFILYTAPQPPYPPLHTISSGFLSLSLRSLLKSSINVLSNALIQMPGVCRIFISLWEKYTL